MSPLLRTALTAIAAVAIVWALIAASGALRSQDDATTQPTPKPGITVRSTQMRTIPDVSAQRRRLVTKDVANALRTFYETAFVRPAATPAPDQSPWPRPTRRVSALMSKQARRALVKDPGPLDQAEDLAIYTGTITFGGLLTFDGRRPVEAFLDVDFDAVGVPVGRSSPHVKLRQLGKIVLKQTAEGWLVDGFDIELKTKPIPTPTPLL